MTIPAPAETAAVDAAIESRRSLRAFRQTPVERAVVERLLAVAARAPSGTNMQPWHVQVLTGGARDALVAAVCAAFDGEPEAHQYEYDYYPEEFFEPYLGRRRKVGFDLYKLVGIAKGDAAAMRAQHRRNFEFFGAPVGLIFTIDRRLGKGSWFDYGMFVQNLMVAARARGLDTCPQAAWAQPPRDFGAAGAAAGTDGGLRHGSRFRRSRRPGQCARHRACAVGRFHGVPRLVPASAAGTERFL